MSPVSVAFEVIERLTRGRNRLLILTIEVNTYWTNLACAASQVLHFTMIMEPANSSTVNKSDLDIEQLPSGKLCVNRIVLLCGMLAFNLLRTIGQEVIVRADLAPVKIKVRRWRLKTVLQNIVYCAVRVIRYSRSIKLHFGKTYPWFDVIEDIAQSRLRPA